MQTIREKLNAIMERIKQVNPDANWGNLVAGVIILVVIAFFSVSYFSQSPENQPRLLQELLGNNEDVVLNDETPEVGGVVVVEAGEGLWHVAARVCGDGEMYNHVAAENGLSIWANLAEGQELIISCDYPVDNAIAEDAMMDDGVMEGDSMEMAQ